MGVKRIWIAISVAAALSASSAVAEPYFWGVQAEQLEYRIGDDTNVFAWDWDAFAGSDEFRLVWRSEAEFATEERAFESLENQFRGQVPISDFFDAVAGVRLDTPAGPDRIYGVFGLHGLSEQWFEIDADLFVSDHPAIRFEVEYEGLITNRIAFTPVIEMELPFTDDRAVDVGAWGPKLEVGGRVSYDLIDRTVAPYIGVHYERVFGETAAIARSENKDEDALFFVSGLRVMF